MPQEEIKTFKVGDNVADVPLSQSEGFLKAYPDAIEVKSFTVGKDTADVPLNDVDGFMKAYPDAKPLSLGKPLAEPLKSTSGKSQLGGGEFGFNQTISAESNQPNVMAEPQPLSPQVEQETIETPTISQEEIVPKPPEPQVIAPFQGLKESAESLPKKEKVGEERYPEMISNLRNEQNQLLPQYNELEQIVTQQAAELEQNKAEVEVQLQDPNVPDELKNQLRSEFDAQFENHKQAVDQLQQLEQKRNQNQKAINILNAGYKRKGGQYEKEMEAIFDKQPFIDKATGAFNEFSVATYNAVVPAVVSTVGALLKSPMLNPLAGTPVNKLNELAGDRLLKLSDQLEVNAKALNAKSGVMSTESQSSKRLYDDINPYNFAQGMGSLAGSLGMTMLGGGVAGKIGGQAAAFSQIYGNSYKDGIKAGLDNNQATLYASAIAAPAAVLEEFGVSKLFDLAVTKGGKKILQEAVLSELKKNAGKMTAKEIFDFTTKKVTQIVASGVVEGGVEVSQGAAEFLTKLGTEAITDADFEGNLDMDEFKKQAFENFALGMVGGSGAAVGIQNSPQAINQVAAEALTSPEKMQDFKNNLELLRINGDITPEGFNTANTALNKAIDVSKTVPATITNVDDRKTAIDLIQKRDELATQLENTDPDLSAPIQEELKNVKGELQDLAKGIKPQISEAQGQAITASEQTTQATKTTENAIQEPSTTQEIPRTGEAGQNIPEGGQGVRPSEQGKETAQQGKEEVTTKTKTDEKTEKGPMLEGLQATGDEGKGRQAGTELHTESQAQEKEIEELAEPIVIFKGNTGKLNPDGSRRTAHPNIQGVFGSTDLKGAERYGNDISKFDIPKGTTIETVEIKNKKIPLSEARKQETELVNASDAQIVRLITYDAKGREVQYIIKDKSILQQNKPLKNAEENLTTNITTNESKNENGKQKDGEKRNENVSENVQGNRKEGGQNVNLENEEEVLTTKQQIENFGVAPEMVEPVNGVISQVFQSLKKAGLTAAQNVGEWIGIGKGNLQQDALKKAEIIKLDNGVIKQNKIRGKLLNESQSKDLQAEIESKYDKPDRIYFGYESDDIRKAMFTYYDPMLTKTINGIDVRVAYGLLRKNENGKNERTYLIYADGKVAGEFYSLNDIKKVLDFVESNLVKSLNKQQISQPLFKKGESKKDFGGFETRDGKPIGFTYDTDKVARERFDFSKLKKIGSGSDRDVFDLGNGKVLKVAKTARGLTQNIYEGDYYLKGIIPEVFERGLNYVVAESTPRIKTSDVVQTFDVDGNSIGTATAGEMLKELQKFSQKNMDNQDSKLQDVLAKYGLQDVMSYNVLWGDFIAQRNWGYKDGVAYHSDGGTFGGVDMITSFKGKANLSDPEFREIYQESKKLKKQFGDTDKATMYKEQGGDVQAQYRIESGKNTIEAIKDFDGSPEAVVALTHEIMHPTVVAIIDGAVEGNEIGTKHTQTIVDEFNKANPKSKVTVAELIAGNEEFKAGTTSEQYRDVQEFIAESWEKYHTEGGKGFSEAFQKVLEQITEAFRAVYKTLTGKQLTPELRQMFDEILGKEAPLVAQPTLSDFGLTYKNVNDKFNEISKVMPYRALETALENLGVERGDLDSAKEAFLAEFISKDLPSKLPNKKDKFDKDDLPKGEVVVKPIIKKITPSNPSNTKTKTDSLKNIVGNDDMRPVMNGVFQDAENGMLAATDAFKLITVSDATITESKIVDPKTGQTIQGRFPNYLAIIPQNNPIQVDVNVQDLINQTAGISRASDFFVGKNEFAIAVRLKIGDNIFYFNPKLLNDVLTVFANYGAKDVTFKLSTPTRAMVIEYGGVTGLVMPVIGENNQGNVLPHVTVVNRELTNKEKADGIKADLEYLSKKLEDKKKKLSDAKNNVRDASSNKDLNSANFDVKYEEKAVAEAQLEYDNKKAELDNLDNPLQEQFDLETVKTAIENGEITEQEATEFIESTIENTTEVESVIENIESKAESNNEVELNEVIQNADKLISSKEGAQVETNPFTDLANQLGEAAKEAVKPETPTAQTFADISQTGKAGRDARESARKKFGKDAVAKMEEISRNFDKLIEQLESENKVRKECP